jgi:putative acetyltransferase
MNMTIRATTNADLSDVLEVHRLAFGSPIEAGLVRDLLADPSAAPSISMIAEQTGQIIGHVLFTWISVGDTDAKGSILCPLAVVPEHQSKGAGSAMIKAGLQRLRDDGCDLVFVLGDPAYYGRFGFQPAALDRFPTPQPIPVQYRAGWMVQNLSDRPLESWQGRLSCADALNKPEYWSD